MKQNLLISLLVVATLAGGLLWFLNSFKLEEVDEYVGFRGEARSNNLYAARTFLQRMGVPSERRDNLTQLPDTDTVILLNTQRYTLSSKRMEQLLDWVESGGHLITRVRLGKADESDDEKQRDWDIEERDLLQSTLGISVLQQVILDEDEGESPFPLRLQSVDKPLMVDLTFLHNLMADDATSYTLRYTAEGSKKPQEAVWMLQKTHGAGTVTLASSLDFVENYAIDRADHARLLWHLVHHDNPEPHVWLLHHNQLPSLPALLIQHAWAILLSLLLLLIFSFWALIPRFGGLIPNPPGERRRILEHIKASGQFMWKQGDTAYGKTALITSSRADIEATLSRRFPAWQTLTPEVKLDYIAPLTGLDTVRLHVLLTQNTLNEQDFITLMQVAERIRKTP